MRRAVLQAAVRRPRRHPRSLLLPKPKRRAGERIARRRSGPSKGCTAGIARARPTLFAPTGCVWRTGKKWATIPGSGMAIPAPITASRAPRQHAGGKSLPPLQLVALTVTNDATLVAPKGYSAGEGGRCTGRERTRASATPGTDCHSLVFAPHTTHTTHPALFLLLLRSNTYVGSSSELHTHIQGREQKARKGSGQNRNKNTKRNEGMTTSKT